MNVSYNRLWKKLIDFGMTKSDLREKTGITTNELAKLGKNEYVKLETLTKICKVLECTVDDIIDLISE